MGDRVAVGAFGADQAGVDSGKTRVYEFQTSDWTVAVNSFRANFQSGTDPEITLDYTGVAPNGATGRTYRTEMLLPSCALGQASVPNAIEVVAPTGNVPATETFDFSLQLNVDEETIRSSGYYQTSVGRPGEGNLAFCLHLEIIEGGNQKAEQFADINIALDMGTEFFIDEFIKRGDNTRVRTLLLLSLQEVRVRTCAYTFAFSSLLHIRSKLMRMPNLPMVGATFSVTRTMWTSLLKVPPQQLDRAKKLLCACKQMPVNRSSLTP